jgi:hypothetical protein
MAIKSESEKGLPPATAGNAAAAAASARVRGLKGAKARAEKLSPARRREIAVAAAKARWAGKRRDGSGGGS